MAKEKNLTIESLRGIAILLVVMGHVIGSTPEGGMQIDYPSWRYLYICMVYMQMPLFTAIAGWVYAYKPIGNRNLTSFIFDKCKRLLIPMAAVGTLYFLVQYLVPGTNAKGDLSNIWKIYLFPYTMFWYLQTLFLIFIVIATIDKLSMMNSMRSWLTILAVSYGLSIVQTTLIAGNMPNYFSFQGMLGQMPYFLAGIAVQRFGKEIYKSTKLYFIPAVIGVILLQLEWFYPNVNPNLYKCLLPLWLIPTLFITLKVKFTSKIFVYIGVYAYSIYLLHGFGTAGGRIILSYLNIHSETIIFLFATLIATLTPILADKVLSKNKYTRMIFLGKRI